MTYQITAKYEEWEDFYVCDQYSLSLDDIVLYKQEGDKLYEGNIISFRNKNFIRIDIERMGEKH